VTGSRPLGIQPRRNNRRSRTRNRFLRQVQRHRRCHRPRRRSASNSGRQPSARLPAHRPVSRKAVWIDCHTAPAARSRLALDHARLPRGCPPIEKSAKIFAGPTLRAAAIEQSSSPVLLYLGAAGQRASVGKLGEPRAAPIFRIRERAALRFRLPHIQDVEQEGVRLRIHGQPVL